MFTAKQASSNHVQLSMSIYQKTMFFVIFGKFLVLVPGVTCVRQNGIKLVLVVSRGILLKDYLGQSTLKRATSYSIVH